MKYRLAKRNDINELVDLHYAVRKTYNIGIFAQLDKSFLKQYYKIVLSDRDAVIVCAEDEQKKILGFCSATIDVQSFMKNISKHYLILGLSALQSIILNPKLLLPLIDRYKSTKNKSLNSFISSNGSRLEYWVWNASNKDSFASIEMHEILLKILNNLGIDIVNFEVDIVNKKIFKFHQYNGAEIEKIIKLSDGRERALMKYNLTKRWEETI